MSNPKIEGQWNGEPAQCRVVAVIVGKEPENMTDFIEKGRPDLKRFLWFVPFMGETRQAIEVIQGDSKFYIDNNDGSGMQKVLNGGSMRNFHRSIYPEHVLNEVPQNAWIQCTEAKVIGEEQTIRLAWMLRDPEGYAAHEERMNKLKDAYNEAVKGRATG